MDVTRSPSEYFIKYLISQQVHDDNTILALLEDYDLDGISARYIKKLRRNMDPFPTPWEPTQDAGITRDYLKKHGIANLWYPNPAIQEAYSVLGQHQLRLSVQQMLLSPLRVEDITRRINKHHEISLTVEGVEAFGHYFWNKRLLSMDEWTTYLDTKGNAYENVTILKASPDMAHVMVPWITGMSGPPPNLSAGMVARRSRDIAFLKVLEIERQPASLAHSKMMKNYMDAIRGAEAEMRQSDVALKDVLAAFDKFRLKKDGAPLPSIEEVAGPNYSQSGEGTGIQADIAEDYVEE